MVVVEVEVVEVEVWWWWWRGEGTTAATATLAHILVLHILQELLLLALTSFALHVGGP